MKFLGAAASVRGLVGVATPAKLIRGTNESKGEIGTTGRTSLAYIMQISSVIENV